MQEDLRQQVLSRLERDYGLKHRSGTEYMRGGKCPSCSKKELYTNHLKPWVVKCNRQSSVGANCTSRICTTTCSTTGPSASSQRLRLQMLRPMPTCSSPVVSTWLR